RLLAKSIKHRLVIIGLIVLANGYQKNLKLSQVLVDHELRALTKKNFVRPTEDNRELLLPGRLLELRNLCELEIDGFVRSNLYLKLLSQVLNKSRVRYRFCHQTFLLPI